jgi:hypothetical protein
MVKKRGNGQGEGGEISLGTDAWNVADRFMQMKVEKLLEELDVLEDLCEHGTIVFDQDEFYTPNQMRKRRVEALEKFVSKLRQLIGNTKFSMNKKDKELYDQFSTSIENYKPYIRKCYRQTQGDNLNEDIFEINEVLFNKIFKKMQEIKDEILYPLNHAGLIFRQSEDIDLDKITRDLIEGG